MFLRKFNRKLLGYTTVELLVTLVVASILIGTAVMSIIGIMPTYRLSRGARMIFNAMLSARSKAVSLNQTYRFNCIDEKHFKLQRWHDPDWIDDGGSVSLPSDVEISQSPFDYLNNCLQNLEFTSRGIIDINNGAQSDPFIVVTNVYTGDEKSITVNIGGNIQINR